MLKWTRWTSGMTSLRIGEMWSPQVDVVSFLKFPESFFSQTVVEQCGVWALCAPVSTEVVPSTVSLPVCGHVPCPVLGGELWMCWEKAGRPLCSCLRAAWWGATPRLLSPVMHHLPHFTRSEALCLTCNSPGWSAGRYSPHIWVGGAGPERLWVFYATSVRGTKGPWPLHALFLPLDPVSSGTTAFQRFTFNTFYFSNFLMFHFETVLFCKKITRKVVLFCVPFSQIHGFLSIFSKLLYWPFFFLSTYIYLFFELFENKLYTSIFTPLFLSIPFLRKRVFS